MGAALDIGIPAVTALDSGPVGGQKRSHFIWPFQVRSMAGAGDEPDHRVRNGRVQPPGERNITLVLSSRDHERAHRDPDQLVPERLDCTRAHVAQLGGQMGGVLLTAGCIESLDEGRATSGKACENGKPGPVGRKPVDALALDAVRESSVLTLTPAAILALEPGVGSDRGKAEQPLRVIARNPQSDTATLRVAHQVAPPHAVSLPQGHQLSLCLGQIRGFDVWRKPAVTSRSQRCQLTPAPAVLTEAVQAGHSFHG